MGKTFRVGVIGFGHMHINDVMRRFGEVKAEQGNVEWVACADTVPDVPEARPSTFTREWNIEYAQKVIGIPKAYADYREMLEKEELDLVGVYSENSKHAEVAEALATKGVSILIEKPMAESLASALRMVRAAKAAGVTLAVNWPSTWSPSIRKCKELLDEGVIGQPIEMKWRSGHTGPLAAGAAHQGIESSGAPLTDAERGKTWWHRTGTGGGALLDYCCYGACLARWYLGQPAVAAFAMAATLGSFHYAAEDNAVISVRFPKALVLLEGSWTTHDHGVPTGPIVYGESGTLVVDRQGDQQVVRICRSHGQEQVVVKCEPLPYDQTSIAHAYIHHLATGEPLHPTLEADFNLEAMAILDAGIRSVQSGKLELVDDARWCVR
jgi:predicted dehydrogenase